MPRKRRSRFWRIFLRVTLVCLTGGLIVFFSRQQAPPEYPLPARSVDVVVIGAGLAGPVAAIAAAEAGAEVFYMNLSSPTSSGFPLFSPFFWAAGTAYQQETESGYGPDNMAGEIGPAGEESAGMALRLSLASAESLSWLEKTTGRAFSRFADPARRPGLHLPQEDSADIFVPAALRGRMTPLLAGESRDLWPETLIFRNGRISGVKVRDRAGNGEIIFSRAVVLADGGIAGDSELVASRTGLVGLTARPDGGHRGVGIGLAAQAGALVEKMVSVPLLTVFLPGGRTFSPAWSPAAVSYLDRQGRAVVVTENTAEALMAAGGRLFVISGDGEEAGTGFVRFEDRGELSLGLGLPPEKLLAGLPDMGAPYWAAEIGVMGVTAGGIAVDEKFRVRTETGVLAGLFVAGEAVSGLPGYRPEEFAFASEIISARLAAAEAALFARR